MRTGRFLRRRGAACRRDAGSPPTFDERGSRAAGRSPLGASAARSQLLALAAALCMLVLAAPSAIAANPAASLDQCANDPAPSPIVALRKGKGREPVCRERPLSR